MLYVRGPRVLFSFFYLHKGGRAIKPLALITGVSRKMGIGTAIARSLARSGWNIAITYYRPYDETMPWGSNPQEVQDLLRELENLGSETFSIEADLSQESSASQIIQKTNENLGTITALVLSHCHSVDSDIQSTTTESFARHFAVNVHATWLLVRDFCNQYAAPFGKGRIIAITSDHVAHNLPYGASKGAMDRIVLAAAEEYRGKGITANVINPGATDTLWMSEELKSKIRNATFLDRVGKPEDCANLVEFLCSEKGGWINGQLLYSNGGFTLH
jgi:3-oxoacyl-[acyl-carrier protein] reductase